MVSSRCSPKYIVSALLCTKWSASTAFSTGAITTLPCNNNPMSVRTPSSSRTALHERRSLHELNVATNSFQDGDALSSSTVDYFGDDFEIIQADQRQRQPITTNTNNNPSNYPPFIENILNSYIGPRITLALVSILYATNFPLGAIMNDALPASAATSGRMVLASLVLSPFLFQLKPNLRTQVLVGGSFVSMGYVAQSIALIDTSPALVSFLGSATVLVCPLLQWLVDKKPMGYKDAPQTWMAAILCLMGVAALELFGSGGTTTGMEASKSLGMGDALSLLQAVGFGTGVFLSEKMMKKEPDQALPITAGLVSVTALYCMLWSMADGWMTQPGWESMGLPGLFLDPNMRTVAMAVAWTGILSTSGNFFIEITALGRVPSSEASVILATEPLWASLFAAMVYHEQFGTSDYVGGILMIGACLVNTLTPSDFEKFMGGGKEP